LLSRLDLLRRELLLGVLGDHDGGQSRKTVRDRRAIEVGIYVADDILRSAARKASGRARKRQCGAATGINEETWGRSERCLKKHRQRRTRVVDVRSKVGSGSDLRGQTDWGNISVRGQLALSGHFCGTCDPER
jgi:hypothetical protein